MIVVIRGICAGLFFYLVYCAILFFAQRTFLYPGSFRQDNLSIPEMPYPVEAIQVKNSFGLTDALFMRAYPYDDGAIRPVAVFAHGNGELITDWPHALRPYLEMGVHVLLVEYPGYGRSDGKPGAATIVETFANALAWVRDQVGVDKDKLIFHGRSIGGAVLVQLIHEQAHAVLILQSTFISLKPFAQHYLVPSFFLRDSFDSTQLLDGYSQPTLIMHGKNDMIVPYKHAEQIKNILPKARLISYECGHNDFPPNWQKYWTDIHIFLKEKNVL
jgi:pimeloyl-ACP methyl ester carboxylesterase